MLLQKRLAFEFESEVRLLWVERAALREAAFIDIDPTAVIDQIRISPHASKDEIKDIKSALGAGGIP
ncbi:MAG: hypothetical protein ACTSWI_01030, partial [Alphaproteobacteria bacterium]